MTESKPAHIYVDASVRYNDNIATWGLVAVDQENIFFDCGVVHHFINKHQSNWAECFAVYAGIKSYLSQFDVTKINVYADNHFVSVHYKDIIRKDLIDLFGVNIFITTCTSKGKNKLFYKKTKPRDRLRHKVADKLASFQMSKLMEN